MTLRVWIDGSHGTTGLRLAQRLAGRPDIKLLSLPEEKRKDVSARVQTAKSADATFLCLPDDAAKEMVAALEGEGRLVLDTSTAHRTDARFAYGFPELSPVFARAIENGSRIAVPGCHASGAIALLYPLIAAGVLSSDAPVCVTSLTGYSGGGKAMITQYESQGRDAALSAPRPYGVTQAHKHLPEITRVCSLSRPPIFQPIVDDYYSGMLVSVPLFPQFFQRPMGILDLTELYRAHYAAQPLISVLSPNPEPLPAANALAGRDGMQVFLTGSDERMIACARFDNLGKGASGAAIECMNIHFGLAPATGLSI